MEIKPGDLVIIVRGSPCCGNSKHLGKVLTVTNQSPPASGICSACGVQFPQESGAVMLDGVFDGRPISASVRRLKKIDPPSEGDSLPTRADLKLEA